MQEKENVASKLLKHSHTNHDIPEYSKKTLLTALEGQSTEDILALIQEEDLSAQGIILAHIEAKMSFEVLKLMPEELQEKVLFKISRMDRVDCEVLEKWNSILKARIENKN